MKKVQANTMVEKKLIDSGLGNNGFNRCRGRSETTFDKGNVEKVHLR